MTPAARAARARALALDAGFDLAGVAAAGAPAELAFFAEWITRGYAGEMAYLSTQREKRSDLRSRLSVGAQRGQRRPPVRHRGALLHREPVRTAAGSRATRGATTITT